MEMKNTILAKIELLNKKIAYAGARKMEIADYYAGKVDGFVCALRHFDDADFKDLISFGIKTLEDVLETNKYLLRAVRRNYEGKVAAYREVLKMVA